MRVGIIGNGNLAGALSKLFLRNGFTNFNITDVDKSKSHDMTNSENIESSDILFLCVKPKDMSDVLPLFVNFENKTIVSMAAGVKLFELEKYSNTCIRMMPNLPIQFGKGIISYYSKNELPSLIKQLCQGPKLLKCREEILIDVSTICHGSMPAFISYFAKEYVEYGVSRGLSPYESYIGFTSTLEGTLEMIKYFPMDHIISQVSSPKGVTRLSLDYLDRSDIKEIIQKSLDISFEHIAKLKQ
jgi:pyrroline-5-carboxylate reductase